MSNNYNEYYKMKCLGCCKVTHVLAEDLPDDIEGGETVQIECPYCGPKQYAVLVEEEQEIVKTSEKMGKM